MNPTKEGRAAKTGEPECILEITGVKFLLPQAAATEAFKLLHGATAVAVKYDDAYKPTGWKYQAVSPITLVHAEPNLRAKLVLGE